MVAEDFLNPGDAVPESFEIDFGRAGQNLHERAAADFVRRVGRETRQAGKRSPFLFAMGALDARVQDQKDAPIPREVRPCDHRRNLGVRAPASVNGQAAALEQGDTHARTRAAIEQARILARVERQSGQPAKRCRNRKRQLSPGPKSGVRGNGVRDDEPLSGIEAKPFGDAARDMGAPLALLAQNFKAWRFAKLNPGFERVDGEANRSKSATKISSEIKKTQMQSRRRRDLNAFQRAPLLLNSFAASGSSEFVATLRNFARFAKRRGDRPCKEDYGPIVTWAPTTLIDSQRCGRPIKMRQSGEGLRLTTGGR